MREAFNKLSKEFGRELVDRYTNNARSIINGENIQINSIRQIKKKKRFWLFLAICRL